MTERQQKAARARKVRGSKEFTEFHQAVLDQQVAVFLNADASLDEIAEAHGMVRALRKLLIQFDRAETDAKIEQKKEARNKQQGPP